MFVGQVQPVRGVIVRLQRYATVIYNVKLFFILPPRGFPFFDTYRQIVLSGRSVESVSSIYRRGMARENMGELNAQVTVRNYETPIEITSKQCGSLALK